ncbi:drug/metabolite transporter (DMT)-like permease [Variovorax beijingensis]|jgi:drug/metabolite transporter (DMT)-like permease|uniref:Drug/metabolite transporter (DMT)-like permease n=2 Tax=Variovorax TaxID=34072 RepID=A0AAE3Y1U7_VARPD|nr:MULTISPECIES: EamA family transporter [Variovorax]MBD9663508.1 EamA family transporter [Variovorax sp. VRV01]MDR6427806.1 drug/metabolite transporter (DMT)-like permease [Variovorax paradoxus]TWD78194.1 drug/metabolite transporter (DMT)-like permease [Variovorax beijingensis]
MSVAAARGASWLRAMPAVFVLIWSTGFIVARYGMPYAPPLKFLAVRFALSLVCFCLWVALARVPWPKERAQWGHLAVTGVLMQAGYLGGVWAAVHAGMGAGLVALLVGIQPVLTAVWLSFNGGRISQRQWAGLVLGFAGLVLVVSRKFGQGSEVSALTMALAVMALLSITAGTLYQKRFVAPCDVRSASAVQMVAALIVCLPFAAMESQGIEWNAHSTGAMAWSVLVLSLGGSSLLYMLIQRGTATAVTSLLYLVPPCTAVMAWLLFAEPITLVTLLGIGLTAAGVSLVVRSER